MPWVVYYDPQLDEKVQLWVPAGLPAAIGKGQILMDEASQLGIIEASLDEFPGIPMAPEVSP